ncbi:MAG: GtrA family protein [Bacteroidales bacterium]|jgi:putative flippase GtrA|nr:GtrA family protein [Bacteroidales bacterium]
MFEFLTEEVIKKFFKFMAVGFSGLFIDYGFTYIFKEKTRVGKFTANAIGFCMAATSNYFLNRIWTFRSHNPEMLIEFSQFFGISLIGLGINTLILWMIVNNSRMNFYVAKLFAIGFVTLWNFAANSYFTFHVG